MSEMEVSLNRIGKMAIVAAMSDHEEEDIIKHMINDNKDEYKVAITFISGMTGSIKSSFIKSIIGCALQNGIVEKQNTQVHAVVHAALDALNGILYHIDADSSVKMKVAIVRDNHWIAVAMYGDSAYNPVSNHERASLGVMHLG